MNIGTLSFVALAAATAAAVEHFASPPGGLRISGAANGNPSIRIGDAAYPRTAIDSDGFIVRLMEPARRIVSQYWSIDDYVYTVSPPEHVVAVSENAYQPRSSNVYSHVQRLHPVIATDPERVLRLDPDLILVSSSARADFCSLVRSSEVSIYRTFTMFETLSQVANTIKLTGYLTGDDRSAADELDRFWAAIKKAQARRHLNSPQPRVLGCGGRYCYGDQTLFNDIVRTLGGRNVGAEGGLKGYEQVNSEQIALWDPEWIVTASDPGKADAVRHRLLADPGIAMTQAARRGQILVFDNHVFLPMSPFTTLLVTAMAEAIYG